MVKMFKHKNEYNMLLATLFPFSLSEQLLGIKRTKVMNTSSYVCFCYNFQCLVTPIPN